MKGKLGATKCCEWKLRKPPPDGLASVSREPRLFCVHTSKDLRWDEWYENSHFLLCIHHPTLFSRDSFHYFARCCWCSDCLQPGFSRDSLCRGVRPFERILCSTHPLGHGFDFQFQCACFLLAGLFPELKLIYRIPYTLWTYREDEREGREGWRWRQEHWRSSRGALFWQWFNLKDCLKMGIYTKILYFIGENNNQPRVKFLRNLCALSFHHFWLIMPWSIDETTTGSSGGHGGWRSLRRRLCWGSFAWGRRGSDVKGQQWWWMPFLVCPKIG